MNEEESDLPEGIDPAQIKRVISVLFVASLFLMMDNGFLPACSVAYKAERKADDVNFGLLGSIVYAGQAIGSLIASPFLQRFPAQYVLAVCLTLNIASLVVFCLVEDLFIVQLLVRMMTGLLQVFFTIYMPVWADMFGNEGQKTLWLALLIVSNPLGAVIGYGMTAGI